MREWDKKNSQQKCKVSLRHSMNYYLRYLDSPAITLILSLLITFVMTVVDTNHQAQVVVGRQVVGVIYLGCGRTWVWGLTGVGQLKGVL